MKEHEERLFETLVNDLAEIRKLLIYIKKRGIGSSHSFRMEQDWKQMKMRAMQMEQKILSGQSPKMKTMINDLIKERKLI